MIDHNHKKSDVKLKKKYYTLSDEDNENLGLDADHSSDDSSYSELNNDNDRVSGNPDGEDDQNDTKEVSGHSPLMDK